MVEEFELFSEYRDGGSEARHYICGDYHLWTWLDEGGSLHKFEFHYKDRTVKYSDGLFSRGSENFIMPVFFIVEQLFACDTDMQAKLLGIRDEYLSAIGGSSSDAGEGLRSAI